jgi:hypothetical protein
MPLLPLICPVSISPRLGPVPPPHHSMMLLIRGRVVYFGPNDRSAIDYVSSLAIAKEMTPYKPGMNDAVRARRLRAGRRDWGGAPGLDWPSAPAEDFESRAFIGSPSGFGAAAPAAR